VSEKKDHTGLHIQSSIMYLGWHGWACHYLLIIVCDIVVFATVHIFIFITSAVDI